jgi:hypothetical protein
VGLTEAMQGKAERVMGKGGEMSDTFRELYRDGQLTNQAVADTIMAILERLDALEGKGAVPAPVANADFLVLDKKVLAHENHQLKEHITTLENMCSELERRLSEAADAKQ